jgi:hypothetical protein
VGVSGATLTKQAEHSSKSTTANSVMRMGWRNFTRRYYNDATTRSLSCRMSIR